MKISAFFIFITLPFFFSGCVTVPSAPERLASAETIAQEAGLERSQVHTVPFLLTAYSRAREPGEALHVYIDGDGYAWVTRRRVSADPTPRYPVALELAAGDPAPNVVYLARPCQFTPQGLDLACRESYWTDKRFSEEVISSMAQAVDQFVREAKSSEVHLIGYSGGAAVATLIAVRRSDVKSLRTVAGNLDPNGLNKFHEVSPMDESSLDPMEVAGKLSGIPQAHFVGSKDAVVPESLIRNFMERSGPSSCIRFVKVDDADHVHEWKDAWPRLLALSLDCSAPEDMKDPA